MKRSSIKINESVFINNTLKTSDKLDYETFTGNKHQMNTNERNRVELIKKFRDICEMSHKLSIDNKICRYQISCSKYILLISVNFCGSEF